MIRFSNTLDLLTGAVCTLLLLALGAALFIGMAMAEDIVPARAQSDAHINVWVDDAPLRLFISQLAEITGRDVAIDGDLPGQVSGRFNGSLVNTLDTVGQQFSVLFDLDEGTLGAASGTLRSSATIALGGVVIDEQVKASLLSDLLTGNDVQVRENEIVVSGHPVFVKRVARRVASSVGSTDQQIVVDSGSLDRAAPTQDDSGNVRIVNSGKADPAPDTKVVIDSAAQQLILDTTAPQTENDAESASSSKAIRWVTDIPGFDTF